MGYTITTPIRSEKDKSIMMDFLNANYKNWSAIYNKGRTYARGPIDNDFSYDDGSCRIGFDYNCSGGEREYIYAICRWISLKVGKLIAFPNNAYPNITGNFPIIIYDGYENMDKDEDEGPFPVILKDSNKVPRNLSWTLVDQYGLKINKSLLTKEVELFSPGGNKIIKKELMRLNKLWTENEI